MSRRKISLRLHKSLLCQALSRTDQIGTFLRPATGSAHADTTSALSAEVFRFRLRAFCTPTPEVHLLSIPQAATTLTSVAALLPTHLHEPVSHIAHFDDCIALSSPSELLMTSAIPPSAQHPPPHATNAAPATSGTTSPLPGAVPAQLPVRSYATATKTASQAAPTPAGASTHNATSTESPVNGANPIAHGGSQPNGTSANADHSRKPSVVINASGASGSIPNGGPVGQQTGRPPIHFGAINASPLPQHSAPYHSQTASLATPASNPRVISPAHSPSPIPQPQASGGRPPAGLQNQTNGMTFGQLGGEGDQVSVCW